MTINLPPSHLFKMLVATHSSIKGDSEDSSKYLEYKASPEGARLIRALLGMPEGSRTRLKITGHIVHDHRRQHTVERLFVRAIGYADYVLKGPDSYHRLLSRMDNALDGLNSEIEDLSVRPENERHVVLIMDDGSKELALIEGPIKFGVIPCALVQHLSNNHPMRTTGSEVIVVAVDREAAVRMHPNLGFSSIGFALKYQAECESMEQPGGLLSGILMTWVAKQRTAVNLSDPTDISWSIDEISALAGTTLDPRLIEAMLRLVFADLQG